MSLSIEQQKELYNGLCNYIIELHYKELKNNLKNFTENFRSKGFKGVVLIDFFNTKDMVESVKNKNFNYQWIPRNDAMKIKHNGIQNALNTMNPTKDCVLVCSLSLSQKHLYINCIKYKDI